jgi:Tfp pilus assembly protein PilX
MPEGTRRRVFAQAETMGNNMKQSRYGGKRLYRGGVLITALVFALIISLFALGVAMVASSNLSRAAVESDYATAIQLADAGVNYELRWLSKDTPTAGQRAHQANNPYTGTMAGIPGQGTFSVHVLNEDGTSPWVPPNSFKVRSTGTINGVSRTVEITGQRRSAFGDYGVFMIGDDSGAYPVNRAYGKLGGSGSAVIGNLGTNGGVDWTSGDSTKVQGDVTFNGYQPTTAESGPNVWIMPKKVQWPSVSQIASQLFPGGLSWLQANNDNGKVKTFSPSDPESLLSNATVKPGGLSIGVIENSSFTGFATSQNEQDKVGGTRYQNGYEGLFGNQVIIFPPGDYYFRGVKMSNGTGQAILIDNASGMVRFWFDGGTENNSLDLPVIFTSTDKNKFRLYFNNCSELSIGGNSTFNGSIYAHNDGCSTPLLPSIKVHGNSTINGSVIGNYLWLAGNSVFNFPNGGGGEADDDYTLWYGFKNTWKEVNPSGGSLFRDGTTR